MLHTFNTPPDIHSDVSALMKFSTAFQVWMTHQSSHRIRVDRAAEVWNVTPEEILLAVHANPFLVLEPNANTHIALWTIGHDDEH